MFECECLAHQRHAAFACAVNRAARVADDARIGADIDDHAVAGLERRYCIGAEEEGPFKIDVDAAVPIGFARRVTGTLDPDARAVHQRVEAAEARKRRVNNVPAIFDPGDVRRDRMRAEFCREPLEPLSMKASTSVREVRSHA